MKMNMDSGHSRGRLRASLFAAALLLGGLAVYLWPNGKVSRATLSLVDVERTGPSEVGPLARVGVVKSPRPSTSPSAPAEELHADTGPTWGPLARGIDQVPRPPCRCLLGIWERDSVKEKWRLKRLDSGNRAFTCANEMWACTPYLPAMLLSPPA